MPLALPARDCSSRLPMDSNHWNRGHEIEWKWKTIRKERIRSLKNKGRQGFIGLGCNLHSKGGLLRWCAIFVTGSSFHLFYGLSTQTPSADADRLCGSLRWTTTSKDNSLHDEEEKAKEQQFKTDKFWPMPILYQYSPQSYFWTPPLKISSNLFAKNINER